MQKNVIFVSRFLQAYPLEYHKRGVFQFQRGYASENCTIKVFFSWRLPQKFRKTFSTNFLDFDFLFFEYFWKKKYKNHESINGIIT